MSAAHAVGAACQRWPCLPSPACALPAPSSGAPASILPRPCRPRLHCRSVLERLLRARLVYRQPTAARAISFEYLNRQLVWSELRWVGWRVGCWTGGLGCTGRGSGEHALRGAAAGSPAGLLPAPSAGPCASASPLPRSELLLFLLPLFNAKAIQHALRSYLPRLPMLGGGAGPVVAAAGGSQTCGICSTADVLAPYEAVPCGHRFCYYCLRSHCLADPQYSCPLCLARVEGMQRVAPAPAAGASGSGKGSGSVDKDD